MTLPRSPHWLYLSQFFALDQSSPSHEFTDLTLNFALNFTSGPSPNVGPLANFHHVHVMLGSNVQCAEKVGLIGSLIKSQYIHCSHFLCITHAIGETAQTTKSRSQFPIGNILVPALMHFQTANFLCSYDQSWWGYTTLSILQSQSISFDWGCLNVWNYKACKYNSELDPALFTLPSF